MPESALLFFNPAEAQVVDAIARRIIPGDADDPGAGEADAATYVDRALSGFLRDLQTFYRRALACLDALCRERHGAGFAELPGELQDGILRELEAAGHGEDGESELRQVAWDDASILPTFFEVVREHILQGTFCDPAYGGNRDHVGWRLLGFPGAHWGYTAEQMQPGVDARAIPVKSLADLRRERPWERT